MLRFNATQVVYCSLVLLFTACNSDTTDQAPKGNTPPVIEIGAAEKTTRFTSGDAVTLTATVSDTDGTIVSYFWSQTAGDPVDLSSANTKTASFIAPDLPSEQLLSFTLTVTDNDGASVSDTVSILIEPPNALPTVYAGEDKTARSGEIVALSAEASDRDGTIVSYSWTQTSPVEKESQVVLIDGQTQNASFAAPTVQRPTVFTFAVTVIDDNGSAATNTVAVTIAPDNEPPSVNAGEDIAVREGKSASLKAEASDDEGSIATIAWQQISDDIEVELSGADTLQTSFIAPAIDEKRTLTFEVTVVDSFGATASDQVDVTLVPNNAPVFEIEGPPTVRESKEITLKVIDIEDEQLDALIYQWQQIKGQPKVELAEVGKPEIKFVAPVVETEQELTFEIVVTDDVGESTAKETMVKIIPNQKPSVKAGEAQTVNALEQVTLTATASDIDGEITAISWKQTDENTAVQLETAYNQSASFIAPDVAKHEVLTFEVTVTDNEGAKATDQIAVTIVPVPNKPPLVDAGSDQTVTSLDEVTLNATVEDEDGKIVAISWRQTAGSSVTLSSTDSKSTAFTAPNVEQAESLIFEIKAKDDEDATTIDTVKVNVQPIPNIPPIVTVGENQTVVEGVRVFLSAEISDTDGDVVSFQWSQKAGRNVVLTPAEDGSAVASFSAPYLSNAETFIFEISATDDDGDYTVKTVAVSVSDAPRKLNDTGMQTCGDYSFDGGSEHEDNDVNCALSQEIDDGLDPVPYGQDGHYGRDADPSRNSNVDGKAGFSFTKLDRVSGAELPVTSSEWGCVRDNVTGLTWEVKTSNTGGLQDSDYRYTWYDSSGFNDRGNPGYGDTGISTTTDEEVAGSDECFDSSRCDTEKYIIDVNASELCGSTAWRLPTMSELFSIINLNNNSPYDEGFFPHTLIGYSHEGEDNYATYWSSNHFKLSLGNGDKMLTLNRYHFEVSEHGLEKYYKVQIRLVSD